MKLEDLKLYQECLDFEKEVWDAENREESNGNLVETVSAVEPDGNSFTANADEFFISEELTNA